MIKAMQMPSPAPKPAPSLVFLSFEFEGRPDIEDVLEGEEEVATVV